MDGGIIIGGILLIFVTIGLYGIFFTDDSNSDVSLSEKDYKIKSKHNLKNPKTKAHYGRFLH